MRIFKKLKNTENNSVFFMFYAILIFEIIKIGAKDEKRNNTVFWI